VAATEIVQSVGGHGAMIAWQHIGAKRRDASTASAG
jgi:hypothetical protein